MTNPDDPLRSVLCEGIPETFPGAVAVIGDANGIEYTCAVGTIDPDGDVPTSKTTTFDVASLTKPIVTTTIALRLVEHGRLALSETVASHVPTLSDTERGQITVGQLLTHTSGLRYHYDPSWSTPEQAIQERYEPGLLDATPGERHEYTCMNYVHLAAVLRECTGEQLETLAAQHVFGPVGMTTAQVGPLDDPGEDVAWTNEHTHGGGRLHGEIHDPIARATQGESGNAGLFTTAVDVARFARMILNDGELDGRRVLSPATVAALRRDQTADHQTPHGLGWRLAGDNSPAPTWSTGKGGIGHTGFTGTSLWIDIAQNRFGVLLSNQVFTGKDDDMVARRERIYGIVGAGRY